MINAEVLRNISVDLEKLFLSTMVSSKMITAKILNPGNEPGSYLDASWQRVCCMIIAQLEFWPIKVAELLRSCSHVLSPLQLPDVSIILAVGS